MRLHCFTSWAIVSWKSLENHAARQARTFDEMRKVANHVKSSFTCESRSILFIGFRCVLPLGSFMSIPQASMTWQHCWQVIHHPPSFIDSKHRWHKQFQFDSYCLVLCIVCSNVCESLLWTQSSWEACSQTSPVMRCLSSVN